MNIGDTIFAPATIPGTGAISVIRVSGPDALKLVDSVVEFKKGTAQASEGYTLKYGTIAGVDDVLVSIFRAPHSYTGEDGAEISCHASAYIVSRILELLSAAGGRSAEPGEFTRRAFVNGKMDLAQAEAVADVIASSSEAAHRVALNQLRGGYSAELRKVREQLVDLSALVELELDFSEEDVEFADRSRLEALLSAVIARIDSLAASFRAGNAIKNGVPVAIVGAVNSGKSTLLNALLGEDRAIVSDIAGTTRDTVEETIVLGGVNYRFIDTAGIRETSDTIEKIGVARSLSAIEKADVVIGVLDGTAPFSDVKAAYREFSGHISEGQSLILVRNKVDAFDASQPWELPAIDISALTGEGLDALRAALAATQQGRMSACEVVVTNQRHFEALQAAASALRACQQGLARRIATDLLAEDLRCAVRALGSITGEVDSDEILGTIFAKFCIGK